MPFAAEVGVTAAGKSAGHRSEKRVLFRHVSCRTSFWNNRSVNRSHNIMLNLPTWWRNDFAPFGWGLETEDSFFLKKPQGPLVSAR